MSITNIDLLSTIRELQEVCKEVINENKKAAQFLEEAHADLDTQKRLTNIWKAAYWESIEDCKKRELDLIYAVFYLGRDLESYSSEQIVDVAYKEARLSILGDDEED